MRRLLLLAIVIASVSGGALAQTLEGRLKQISETKLVRVAHRSDACDCYTTWRLGLPACCQQRSISTL
jgi:hypothetical protein